MTSLAVQDFATRSIMPAEDVLELDARKPGFLDAAIADAIEFDIYARLRKRYVVPFPEPAPRVVSKWVALLVTPLAYLARGADPNDPTLAKVDAAREQALVDIKETADAKDGLYDLPLREGTDASGVAKGTPLSYSEASPYDWLDVQAGALDGCR